MLLDWLKQATINRLTFNSNFDPFDKFILNLPEKDFMVLYEKAQLELQARAESARSVGTSIGKRGCDTFMVGKMKEYCKHSINEEERP